MNKHLLTFFLCFLITLTAFALPDTDMLGTWDAFPNFSSTANNTEICLPEPPMPPGPGPEDLCPFVNAGPDQTICSGNCVTLTADYAEIYSPSNYNIQNVPYAPASYNDPGAVNVIVDLDDIWSGVVNMPFGFCFYGNTYNQMVIGANGVISFNTSYANTYCVWPINNGLPSATMSGNPFTNVICAPFHDIDPSVGFNANRIRYHVEGTAPCRRMIITWKDVPMFSGACNSQLATQQIILNEASNIIETHIQNKPLCASWNGGKAIHGIQNSTGTSAAVVPGRNNPTQWVTSNEGKRFAPNGSPLFSITWLQNGTVVGNGASINVCPTATTTYTCQVVYTRCNGATATYTDQVTVNVNNNATVAITGGGAICGGASTTLNAPAGLAPYTWSNGGSGASINVTTAGTYTVTVTAGPGCTATASTTVALSPNPTPSISGSLSFCPGGNTTLTATGGGTYQWNTGGIAAAINVTNAGTYTVTVTNAQGCTATAQATVTVQNNLTPSITGTPNFCQGGSSVLNAGAGFATYLWSTTATSQTITVNSAGTYTVTVSSASGCTGTASINITVSPLPTAAISGNNALCAGAATTLIASGGGTYLWNDGSTSPSINVSPAGSSVYAVTVTNAQGCTATASRTVTVNPTPAVNVSGGGNVCEGSPLSISASGGGTYQWSGPAGTSTLANPIFPNADASMSGNYLVTVTSAAGCTATAQVSANIIPCNCPNPPSVLVNGNGAICADGVFNLSATIGGGATSITWTSNGSGSFDNNTALSVVYTPSVADIANGNMTFTATTNDPDGASPICQATLATISLPINPLPTPTATSNGPLCNGETVVLNATGGTAYLWSGFGIDAANQNLQNPSIPNLTSTSTYFVTVTDNGCTSTTSVTVQVAAPVSTSITGDTQICQGDATTLTATGAFVGYSWSTGDATASIVTSASGNYAVTVTDANGCTATAQTTLNTTPLPTPSITAPSQICAGATATLTANSGYANYTWNTGATAPSIDVTTAGTYTVTVTDVNGCTGSAETTLQVAPLPTPQITGINPICNGETSILDAGFYDTYQWSVLGETGQTLAATTSGTYTVTVTNANGCTASNSFVLTVNPLPTPSITGDTNLCAGESTTLTVAGGSFADYQWSNGENSGNITTDIAGPYFVTVTNAQGCTATTSTTVVVNQLPIPTIYGPVTFCTNTEIILSTDQTFASYIWTNASPFFAISVTTQGDYAVTVTNAEGCTGVAQVSVSETVVTPQITGDFEFCNGDNSFITAAPGYSNYTWSTGATIDSINVDDLGTYTVTVTNAEGCTGTNSVDINLLPLPTPSIIGDLQLCSNEQTILSVDTSAVAHFAWSTGVNDTLASITLSNLAAGNNNYTVIVTDTSGCVGSATATVVQNQNPTPNIIGDDSICAGETSLLDAGAGFATYAWNTGDVTQTVSATTTGTYTVTVTTAAGCTASDSFILTVNPLPTPNITGDNSICQNETSLLDAGAGFANYAWNTGASAQTLVATTTGTYTVTVTTAADCTATNDFTLTVNPLPTPNITGLLSFCTGFSTTIDAGAGYANYNWSNGLSNQAITVNAANTYTVTVTTAAGCTATDAVTTTINSNLTPNIIGNPVICGGASATLDAEAGYATYTWSNGEATQAIAATVASTYTVTVTDASGCSGTDAVTVTVNANPTPTITGDDAICAGETSTLDAGAYAAYQWSVVAETNQTLVANATDTYSVTVTDNNGCVGTDEFTLTVNANPTPTITGDDAVCAGETSTLDAGAGFVAYNWNTGGTSQTLVANASANYTITVTDNNGCIGTDDFTLTVNANPTPQITGDDAICAGETSTLDAGAGYTNYAWNNGTSAQTLVANTAGTYTVTVTDNNGCVGTDEFVLTINANPTPNIGGSTSFCVNGNTTLDAGAGYAAYNWNTAATTQTLFVNAPNTYTVTVTDGNGCIGTDAVTVIQTTQLSPTIVGNPVICSGASATLDAEAGYNTYAWNTGATSQTIAATTAGSYTVTVTDATGCSGTDNIDVTVNTNPTPQITGDDAVCAGQSSTLDAGAGYANYAWNNGTSAQTLVANTTGTYTVTVTSAAGCIGSDEFILTINANPTPTITGNNAICAGQTSTLDAGAGYANYAWNNGTSAQTLVANATGTYTVTVTDGNGCVGTDEFILTVNANPTPQITGDDAVCAGQTSTIDAGAGYANYAWNTGTSAQTLVANTAGTYTVTVTDNNGCTGTDTFTLTVNANPTPQITGDDVVCAGQSSTLDAGAGYANYAWNNGTSAQTLVANTAATYTVTVTDNNGCTGTDTFTLTVNANPTPQITGDDAVCAGETSTLDAGAGYANYAWNNGTSAQTLVANAAGTYTVTVTDNNGCVGTDTFVLSINANPTPNITGALEFCTGFSTVLNAGTYTAYQWSVAGQTAANLTVNSSGTFTVTVTDANGCTGTDAATTTMNANLTPNITGTNGICAGETATLNAGSYTEYVWSVPAQTTATLVTTTAGTYTVTVTDVNGCTGVDNFTVALNPDPLPNFTSVAAICVGDEVLFTYTGSTNVVTYNWNFGNGETATGVGPHAVTYNNLGTQTITLDVVDANGCTNSVSHTIIVSEVEATVNTNITELLFGTNATLQAIATSSGNGNLSYQWNPAGADCVNTSCSQITVSPDSTTLYTVTVTDQYGCAATADKLITVYRENELIIPNGFSPNGDGINDVFQFYGVNIEEIEMQVFDRWGQKMYDAKGNTSIGWNGEYKGKVMEVGVYVYQANVKFIDGTNEFVKGNVTLIR